MPAESKSEHRPRHAVYSCVMDKGPKFAYQTKLWVETLRGAAGVAAEDIVVHAIDRCDTRQVEGVERLGVKVVRVQPFDARHPFSNKLVQLDSPALADADYVVPCDCDLAFVGPIEELLCGEAPKAKPTDTATPEAPLWQRIFARFGLEAPVFDSISTWSKRPTIWNNCNGGIYVFPQETFRRLAEPWRRWDRTLIEKSIVLEGQDMFIDQVAFALACRELGIRVEHFGPKYNTPTHLEYTPECRTDEEPVVLHYHSAVDRGGFLALTADDRVNAAIEKVNAQIKASRRHGFDNLSFWEYRYAFFPEAGSGVGSRGETLAYKSRVLKEQVRRLKPATVLDVGCGDLEVSRRLPVRHYFGVDISEEAVRIARGKRRGWRFAFGDFLTLDCEKADIVICLDVLIHQPSVGAYEAFCEKLLSLAGRTLLVAAYNQAPWHTSELTFYYEPISATVQRLRPDARLEIVGGYRDTTLLRVDLV